MPDLSKMDLKVISGLPSFKAKFYKELLIRIIYTDKNFKCL
jgi:hypothetical protein